MEEFELEPGETITRTVRTHMFVLLFQMVPFVVLALLPFVVMPVLTYIFAHTPGAMDYPSLLMADIAPYAHFMLGFWWLMIWISAFTVFTRYWLTVWIITTTRIVDIRQNGFFRREVSSFLLARVQDVTTDVSGFFPTLIGFGSLRVETAGRAETFDMSNIVDPEGIRDLIMREIADLNAPRNLPDLTGV